jgi:hypothetical protein
LFEPKVMTCGVYNCSHCDRAGRCQIGKISIGKDGKCSQMTFRVESIDYDDDPDKEFYPYTDRC